MTAEIGWSFLRSRRWLGYFALFVIFAVACVLLGNWQFERRAEARAEINRLDANYYAAAVPIDEIVTDPARFDEDRMKWHPVLLRGEYVGDTYLARNRPGEGRVGSDLIQAFKLDDGRIFFIDRGWVPVDGNQAVPKDLPRGPEGEIEVRARLRASEPAIAGRTSTGHTVASIDVPELIDLAGVTGEVYSASYGQLISETPSAKTGALPPKPERDEGPHLSYALQWYVFILIALIGVGYAARQEYRTLNAGGETVRRQDERSARRKQRRGPSDADEEDAMLDA
ncbi:SURF1 family protein [Leucobacter sp. HNU]|uniref:SURF1 family cytochrome oxidase biogenesis protein n=1 Tax=Leucobacter sp. HNU TaxID=3236805 RepID=UPI003A80A42C